MNPLFNFLAVLFRVLILLFFTVCNLQAASIRYDQSQFGDYNVQIHLKNIELYAILDEGILNSEYDYDYSELTEKPSATTNGGHHQSTSTNTTTSKPHSSTIASHVNFAANNNPLSSINSSAIVITNQLLATPERIDVSLATDDESNNLKITKKCAPGYYKDNLGRCRRLRKPHLPILQMVHTPGVIKSFQQIREVNVSSNGKPIKFN